jgi:hypothetical protein
MGDATDLVLHTWSPDNWQSHCDLLLNLHYQFDYQRVPDSVRGDLGIEGYSRDGCLYQCYAAEPGLTHKQLYERQRDKMTVDLGKLVDNAADLEKLLGGLTIRRWVFLVPRFEGRDVLVHAGAKSADIRGRALAFVSEDFQVVVTDDSRFAAEKARLGDPDTFRLSLSVAEPAEEDLTRWEEGQSTLLDNLTRKLNLMSNLSSEREALRRQVIRHYLQIQSLDASLNVSYTGLWLRLNSLRSSIEATLPGDVLLRQEAPMSVTKQLVADYAARVERDCPLLVLQSRLIAWGVVASWLLECNLDFERGAA